MTDLSIEKKFLHDRFCRMVQTISLPEAKELLMQLHHLYLGQQSVFSQIAKGDANMIRDLGKKD